MALRKPASMIVGAALALGLMVPAMAGDAQTRIQELESRIAQLEGRTEQSWLSQRQAEEVKSLVREVLADADTRTSLLQEGMTAGHDGAGRFFLQSADGSFYMNITGQVQFRWIYNDIDSDIQTRKENEAGFQVRRTKLRFRGHVADPRITYDIILATDRGDGNVYLEDVKLGYQLTDELTIEAGRFKLPFLREQLTSSTNLLAVERSLVHEVFTAGRAEQVQLSYSSDMLKAAVSLSDGANSTASEFSADAVDFAVTARADVKLAGDWKQWNDYSAWSEQDFAAFVGAAIHYENAKAGDGQAASPGVDNFVLWTVDGSIEVAGLGVSGAFMGAHIDAVDGMANSDNYGAVVQVSYMVIPDKLEPFVRYEWIDPDGFSDINLIGAGVNYYLNKHAAKFTLDVVYGIDPLPGFTGLGLRTDEPGNDGQLAVRAQFQLLF